MAEGLDPNPKPVLPLPKGDGCGCCCWSVGVAVTVEDCPSAELFFPLSEKLPNPLPRDVLIEAAEGVVVVVDVVAVKELTGGG